MLVQLFPHEPQFKSSVRRSTQTPPQSVRPMAAQGNSAPGNSSAVRDAGPRDTLAKATARIVTEAAVARITPGIDTDAVAVAQSGSAARLARTGTAALPIGALQPAGAAIKCVVSRVDADAAAVGQATCALHGPASTDPRDAGASPGQSLPQAPQWGGVGGQVAAAPGTVPQAVGGALIHAVASDAGVGIRSAPGQTSHSRHSGTGRIADRRRSRRSQSSHRYRSHRRCRRHPGRLDRPIAPVAASAAVEVIATEVGAAFATIGLTGRARGPCCLRRTHPSTRRSGTVAGTSRSGPDRTGDRGSRRRPRSTPAPPHSSRGRRPRSGTRQERVRSRRRRCTHRSGSYSR